MPCWFLRFLVSIQGQLLSLQNANLFARHFADSSTLPASNLSPPTLPTSTAQMSQFNFCPRKVRRVLNSLDINKTTGPDGIPAIVLKKCAPELAPLLSDLYNVSLSSGKCPSAWKSAHVVPVPKKGDHSLPSNYRPIAITSVLCKVFESLISEAIMQHCEKHSIINDRQYGFRKQRSTGDLLTYVTQLWSSAIDRFGESTAVALDISKAFDRVWHPALLAKLNSAGVFGTIISWIEDFLSSRSISVRVDGFTSNSLTINAGVPQGCVLSPLLFLIFINDMLSLSNIHSYADDSTLHNSLTYGSQVACKRNITNDRKQCNISLEAALKDILQWGEMNRVSFNDRKTQVLRLTLKKHKDVSRLHFGNQDLNNDNSICLLGVTITSNLSWSMHIREVARRASIRLSVLWRARQYFTSQQLILLYKAQVRPIMEYCSHVWPQSGTSILDRIQSKAIRLINDKNLTIKLQSLSHRRHVACLCLFYRYYFGLCSKELADSTPRPRVFMRNTRASSYQNSYLVTVPHCRTELYRQSFFPRTANIWNKLPAYVFPLTVNLQSFKNAINKLALDSLL